MGPMATPLVQKGEAMLSFGQPFAKVTSQLAGPKYGPDLLALTLCSGKSMGKVSQPAIWSGSALVSSG